MADREIYTTAGKATYVIQFQKEDGTWKDSLVGAFWSADAAIEALRKREAVPYPMRVVERT